MALMDVSLSTIATLFLWPVLLTRLVILATSLQKPASHGQSLPDDELPHYSVLVPLYREANLIPQLVASFRAMDYPPARREILFLIEADDAETREALSKSGLPYACHVITVARGQPRTKPRALNVGLLFAPVVWLLSMMPKTGPSRSNGARRRLLLLQARPRPCVCRHRL